MVRLADVAQLAQVSSATASLVLSGKGRGRVSEATSKRVRDIAAEIGYVANAAAVSLRTQETNTIGFLSDFIASTPYGVRMVESANRVAVAAEQLLLLVNTEGSLANERMAIDEFRRHGVQRTVYACMFHREVAVPEKLPGRVVILDGYSQDDSVPAIVPDEYQGASEAVQLLIDAGCQRIAYLGEVSREGAAAELRLEAYRDAIRQTGLSEDSLLMRQVDAHQRDRLDAETRDLLVSAHPDAVFCFNDIRADSVYRMARRLGLRIPEDISVVGFDNLDLIAERLDPPLTTVELPHAEMGEWAVRELLEPTPAPSAGYPVRQRCRLIIRDSVRTPS